MRHALKTRDWPRLVRLAVEAMQANRWAAAEWALQNVLAQDPRNRLAILRQAQLLRNFGRCDEAFEIVEAGRALYPEDDELLILWAEVNLARGGEPEDGLAALEIVQERGGPRAGAAAMGYVQQLAYLPDVTAEDLREAGAAWEQSFLQPSPNAVFHPRSSPTNEDKAEHSTPPPETIRIGYYSPDLRRHSIVNFFRPILEHHDRTRFEIFIYNDTPFPDEITEELRQLPADWREINVLNAADAARRIAEDRLDLLVELTGLFGAVRPEIFALLPAPVQVHLLGYNGTTGLSCLDYRFTDAVCEPHGTESASAEQLIRLEPGFHCYRPLTEGGEPGPPPHKLNGCITFGSFNALPKINDEVIALWARVLQALPQSRLFLKAISLANRDTRERLAQRFARHGISRERLDILPGLEDPRAHLHAYRRVDIALDTFPCNGTTTTCEALWMGVPVITLLGQRHSARISASLLLQLGLQECVAHSEENFVDKALALAAGHARLRHLRSALREQIRQLPLGDPGQYVPRLEAAYRAILQR